MLGAIGSSGSATAASSTIASGQSFRSSNGFRVRSPLNDAMAPCRLPSRAIAPATDSRGTPRCSAIRPSRKPVIARATSGRPRDSTTMSHSESSAIERLHRLAEPMRIMRSSATITLECTSMQQPGESPGMCG